MFNLIKKLLRSKINKTYNINLITTLHKDHIVLINQLNIIERDINQNSKNTKKDLSLFLNTLKLHLLLENSKLYTYLELKYKYCELDKLKKIKVEIPDNLYLFDKLQISLENNKKNESKLLIEKIKKFLIKRISFEEEKLYSVYTNIYKCNELKGFL
jgi:hypothetical protein